VIVRSRQSLRTVRTQRSARRPDHLDPVGAKDLVEGAAELCVTVVDQQLEVRGCVNTISLQTGQIRTADEFVPQGQ